jgi:hypothetical protein
MALTFRAFELRQKRRFGYFSRTIPGGRLNRHWQPGEILIVGTAFVMDVNRSKMLRVNRRTARHTIEMRFTRVAQINAR